MSEGIRARLAQQSDEQLLFSYYFEDLSAAGKQVATELVADRIGPLEAYLAPFASEQGEQLLRYVSTRVVVDGDDELPPLPPMRGIVLFAEHGVGVIPTGRYRPRAEPSELGDGVRVGPAAFLVGGLAGVAVQSMARQVASDLSRIGGHDQVPNMARPRLPLPLLARLDRHAVWLSADLLGELRWSVGGGEVYWDDDRVFECDLDLDTRADVAAWAKDVGWPMLAFTSR